MAWNPLPTSHYLAMDNRRGHGWYRDANGYYVEEEEEEPSCNQRYGSLWKKLPQVFPL